MNRQQRIFFTGATGLVGRELVPRLLARGAAVTALVRPSSMVRHEPLFERWRALAVSSGGALAVAAGDVAKVELGLEGGFSLAGFDHIFHAAAVRDLEAAAATLHAINADGTRRLVELALAHGFAGTLHLLSSVAVAGDHRGVLREDQLDIGQRHVHPYQRSTYLAEAVVRAADGLRHRIYRPAWVVGHSRTGATSRSDGPYHLFRAIRQARAVPLSSLSLAASFDAPINMVPVDHVAEVIDFLAFAPGLDGSCFHVVDPRPPGFRHTYNLIARAARAPWLLLGGLSGWLPRRLRDGLGTLVFLRQQAMRDLGMPPAVAQMLDSRVRFDTRVVDAALAGSGIVCPAQDDYVAALWRYWARHLDPTRDRGSRRRALLAGRLVVIIGASSGVGAALAHACARAGARVVLVARRQVELAQVCERIREDPLCAHGSCAYQVCDLTDAAACDQLIETILLEHGVPDLLVNNAGHSIRRGVLQSLERYHDFERVMRLNFFAPVRLMRGFLPAMRERGSGRIVNVLTAGVTVPTPFFAAYGASKAALAHLTDTMNAELMGDGLELFGVYLPWVRTPMMDATGRYKDNAAMTPEQAAAWILDGVARRRNHIMDGESRRRMLARALSPRRVARITGAITQLYADDSSAHPDFTLDRAILARLVKGKLL